MSKCSGLGSAYNIETRFMAKNEASFTTVVGNFEEYERVYFAGHGSLKSLALLRLNASKQGKSSKTIGRL